jgi:hypothetical protein
MCTKKVGDERGRRALRWKIQDQAQASPPTIPVDVWGGAGPRVHGGALRRRKKWPLLTPPRTVKSATNT